MKRKLKRSIYCIVCVLTILSVSCIAAFADGAMYDAGVAPYGVDFVTGPSIFVSHDCYVDYPNSVSEHFNVNNSLQAYLPSEPSHVMDYYYDDTSTYFDNVYGDQVNLYYSCEYSNFSYDDLTVSDLQVVSGSVSADFFYTLDLDSKTTSVSYSNYLIFTVRDFYCWDDASEVEFGLSESTLGFVSSDIYYSVNGSDEILSYTINDGDISAYDNLDFSVINDYLPGVSSSDVVYIYSWDLFIVNARNFHSFFGGYIEYNFNPSVRSIDINAGRGFDSDNPAVPLLDYTAWIGTAVSGFLDLQFFPNFTLGGVLMTLLAFTCVIWFLKLVAGG